ncbi:MAG: SBBP repeat-containing protein, partial [Bacteroidota bacterium]
MMIKNKLLLLLGLLWLGLSPAWAQETPCPTHLTVGASESFSNVSAYAAGSVLDIGNLSLTNGQALSLFAGEQITFTEGFQSNGGEVVTELSLPDYCLTNPESSTNTAGLGGPQTSDRFDTAYMVSTENDLLIRDMVVDSVRGIVYVTGEVKGTAQFGEIASTDDMYDLPDFFLAAKELDGDYLWVKRVTGQGGTYGQSLTLDEEGNVYALGRTSPGTIFENLGKPLREVGVPFPSTTLVKYSPTGSVNWMGFVTIRGISQGANWPRPAELTISKENEPVMLFSYSEEFLVWKYVNGQLNQVMSASGRCGTGSAWLRWQPDGTRLIDHDFTKCLSGDPLSVIPKSIAIDSKNNVFVGGSISRRIGEHPGRFYPDREPTAEEKILITNNFDAPILITYHRYHSQSRSIVSIGDLAFGPEGGTVEEVSVDAEDRIFVAGSFTGDMSLAGVQLPISGVRDVFVGEFELWWEPKWLHQLGGPGKKEVFTLTPTRNSLLYGGYLADATFGTGESSFSVWDPFGTKDTIWTVGDRVPFVGSLSDRGKALYHKGISRNEYSNVTFTPTREKDAIISIEPISKARQLFAGNTRKANNGIADTLSFPPALSLPLPSPGFVRGGYIGELGSPPAISIRVLETLNGWDGVLSEAYKVELWNTNDESIEAKIEENGVAYFQFDEVLDFTNDLYVLREDGSLLGKVGFKYLRKNAEGRRTKEVVVIVHNHLVGYNDFGTDGYLNEDWAWSWFYRYKYENPISANESDADKIELEGNFHFPTTMFVAPYGQTEQYEGFALDFIHEDRAPMLFVHGVSGTDQYWGDDITIQEDDAEENPMYIPDSEADYAHTSYPG